MFRNSVICSTHTVLCTHICATNFGHSTEISLVDRRVNLALWWRKGPSETYERSDQRIRGHHRRKPFTENQPHLTVYP